MSESASIAQHTKSLSERGSPDPQRADISRRRADFQYLSVFPLLRVGRPALRTRFVFFSILFVLLAFRSLGQTPEWIWHPNDGAQPGVNETRFFRKVFTLPKRPAQAILAIAADDEAEVWINGSQVTAVKGWNSPSYVDVSQRLKPGENTIAIRGTTGGGEAGIVGYLQVEISKRDKLLVVTDTTWQTASVAREGWEKKDFSAGASWPSAASRGKHGAQPWGDVLKQQQATRAEDIAVLPGFKVELLRSASIGEGSWICMTIDNKGRLIISPQGESLPLWRVTLGRNGDIEKWESIPAPVRHAMGLLYSHNSLYVNGHGPKGTGLYRLIDKNKNDRFDTNEVSFLKTFKGEGEHGYHAVVEGPDKMIYVMCGNHTKIPDGLSADSPHKNYEEDFLLPRQWDAGGHAVGIMAPGGWVVRTDPEGKKWELMLAGFRNAYDFDFNAEGELFTFDSDMEWEWGTSWYRPTRIIHCVTGGEYGWRSGSGKWPAYYADSLPATLNMGVGSPTGVKFGTKSDFPEKYKKAFYAMDWSYGRIFAVHLMPTGASYTATSENFIKGKPLNVTDLEFGEDGAMYFITGGRGTQSGLYRVSHVGEKINEPKKAKAERAIEAAAKESRELRHALEVFDGRTNPVAVEVAWPFMGNSDRFIRYAARIAVESQDVGLWKDRALNEDDPVAGLNALLALARRGGKGLQNDLLLALKKFPFDSLSDEQKLVKLRLIELSFIRQGKPEAELAKLAAEKLNRQYPSNNLLMNRELSQLLIYLEAPEVVEKTMALLDKAETQEEQFHYIFHLRTLKSGWTMEQRRHYFEWLKRAEAAKASDRHPPELLRWFNEAGREYADGASYTKHLAKIREEAVATLTASEKTDLADLISDKKEAAVAKAPPKQRKFVKEWTMADLEPALDNVSSGRNFESGKTAFQDAQCALCHRFGNEGGAVGPELTAASSKYTRRDILESILEPSKVVSEQFQSYTIVKKDGEDVTGRIMDENNEKIVIAPNILALENRIEIKKSDIAKREAAKLSPMPEGLANNLTKAEILDLLAYIESVGKAKAANFKK